VHRRAEPGGTPAASCSPVIVEGEAARLLKDEDQRRLMVAHIARQVRDTRVLDAMLAVPRHLFVPEHVRVTAYSDAPVAIGRGQTISQPLMVAILLEALELRGSERVLDVGTGSGYQTALLAQLAAEVWSIEIIPELAERARGALAQIGARNVHLVTGDGSLGWSDAGPYDAIVVAAASPRIPPPLVAQLADHGRLVMPVGERYVQRLIRVRRHGGQVTSEDLGGCVFVPLVGEHGVDRPHWRAMQLAAARSTCRRAEELLSALGAAVDADERARVEAAVRITREAVRRHDAGLARDRAAVVAAWLDRPRRPWH